ncbi:hypothetical protein BH09BAC2_BH09BAC2_02810 [soil metagenome]
MKKSDAIHTDKKVLKELMWQLNLLLLLSRAAYGKYMKNKIYLHALNIHKANKAIYELLMQKNYYLPYRFITSVTELLNHYDIWFSQFKYHEVALNPRLEDEFIFHQLDDQSAFPKHAEKLLFEYFEKLHNKGDVK